MFMEVQKIIKRKRGLCGRKFYLSPVQILSHQPFSNSVRSSPEDVLIESSTIEMKAEGKT